MNTSLARVVLVAATLSLTANVMGQTPDGSVPSAPTGQTNAEPAGAQAEGASVVTLEDKVIRLPSGSTHGDLLANLQIKSEKTIQTPEIRDVSDPSIPGRVEFVYVGQKQLSKTEILLWFRVSVDNFPSSLAVQRSAVLEANQKEYKLSYTLTNLSGTPPACHTGSCNAVGLGRRCGFCINRCNFG